MAKFTLELNQELRGEAETIMQSLGVGSVAALVRQLIRTYGKRNWTDEDMKDFARAYSRRTPNPPSLLEIEDHQLSREFERFKKSR